MTILRALRIAYWAAFRPDVFDEFVRLYRAMRNYQEKRDKHTKCFKERLEFEISKRRFRAALRG